MRLPDNILQKSKIVLHGVQGLVIFLAWAITIAIFTKDGSTDGRVKYFFALCWFCIPLLIYQTAIPQFDRVKRFSNAYAHAVIDILLAIFWFAAFISVATWTTDGIKHGVARPGHEGCAAFKWGGGASKCHLSQAIIGMGVVVFILFLATSFISIKNLLYYRRNGSLPGLTSSSQHPTPLPLHEDDDQTKYAFSSNPHDEFDNEDEHLGAGPSTAPNTSYELLHDSHAHENPSTTNTHSGPYDEEDTSYHGSTLANPPQLPPHRDPFRDRDPSPYRVQHPVDEEDTGFQGRYDTTGYGNHGAGAAGAGDPFRDDLALSHDHGGYAGAEGAGGRVAFPHADYGRT
ncbi:MAG: hypothetical protein L6R38_008216 [Xanthoria sp. 2 TBL-2021]|nr:MAG: hypothetical protein L6R38_008216 [Xanthoria sp. 2 TBL-2021]